MNFENYQKWIQERLIPNLPTNSVVVIDNAPYHNVQVNRAPTSSSRKSEMTKWLSERNIPHSESMLKPQLYTLIKLYKPQHKTFKIDSILANAGHSALRLPPYHPDLNPIELVWSQLKGRVAKRNVNFSMSEVTKLVTEECNAITEEDWRSCCNHTRKIEEAYMEREPLLDVMSEEIVIHLGRDSSSETSESDYSCSEIESDGSLSGVENL
uniref:Tc1-like transposase DDE domain-containing protein n=1 Tax=Cacopsylla melanoneura TaxID=428564 RepID=A0A8D9E559_9HEMI